MRGTGEFSNNAWCLLRPSGQHSHTAAEQRSTVRLCWRFPLIGSIHQNGHCEEETGESLARPVLLHWCEHVCPLLKRHFHTTLYWRTYRKKDRQKQAKQTCSTWTQSVLKVQGRMGSLGYRQRYSSRTAHSVGQSEKESTQRNSSCKTGTRSNRNNRWQETSKNWQHDWMLSVDPRQVKWHAIKCAVTSKMTSYSIIRHLHLMAVGKWVRQTTACTLRKRTFKINHVRQLDISKKRLHSKHHQLPPKTRNVHMQTPLDTLIHKGRCSHLLKPTQVPAHRHNHTPGWVINPTHITFNSSNKL